MKKWIWLSYKEKPRNGEAVISISVKNRNTIRTVFDHVDAALTHLETKLEGGKGGAGPKRT